MPTTVKANERKLIKVTLEYDDGEVRSLSGDVAALWLKEVNGAIMMDFVHGGSMTTHEWEIEREVWKSWECARCKKPQDPIARKRMIFIYSEKNPICDDCYDDELKSECLANGCP